MKTTLELFTDTAGWTVTTGMHPDSVCEHPQYIADGLAASLVCHVPPNKLGVGMKKTLSLTLPAGYDQVVLTVWSRNQVTPWDAAPADFPYLVSLDGVRYYAIPCYEGFNDVSFRGIPATVNRIEIVPNHASEDYLLLSAMYAIKEMQPLDLMQAFVTSIQAQVDSFIGSAFAVGSVTCRAGQRHITTSGPWIDRYAVIKISGGGHTEYHQIEVHDESGWTFMSTFDGPVTKYAYTEATVSLYFPVRVGSAEIEIAVPGITLWTMGPEPVMRQSGIETWTDSWESVGLTSIESREPMNLQFPLMIDCEGRQHEVVAAASAAVRRALGRNVVWVNGRSTNFEWTSAAQYIEPSAPVETLPKVQYTVDVEVKESREAPVVLVPVNKVTTDVGMGMGVING